jgi:hypothetical protein
VLTSALTFAEEGVFEDGGDVLDAGLDDAHGPLDDEGQAADSDVVLEVVADFEVLVAVDLQQAVQI